MACVADDTEAGAVTVEAAVALAALTTVFGMVLAGISAMSDQLRCTDAAREAARLVARGDRVLAGEAVRRIAPTGARLTVATDGDRIDVAVHAEPLGSLAPWLRLVGRAFAVAEPAVVDGVGAQP